jgi:hypothetical protein
VYFFTFDEMKIPTKFYPEFVEISISVSILIAYFGQIEIPTKFYSYFVEISISNQNFDFGFNIETGISILILTSVIRLWFWFRNRISIPTWEFRFQYQTSISMLKFQNFCHGNKSKFIFWLVRNFNFGSAFQFRSSKTKPKFRLLSIISTNNFDESRK